MGLITSYELFGKKRKNVYLKIIEVRFVNLEYRGVQIRFVTYLSHGDRQSDFANHTGSRLDLSYVYDPEEKDLTNVFFTESLIKKSGLLGESYRYLKSLPEFEGAQDA